MKDGYSRLRALLTAFAVGVVTVYVWQAISMTWWGPPVDLPEARSANVLEVRVPVVEKPEGPKYLCDEFTQESEKTDCLDQVIFEGRNKELYIDGGRYGCGREEHTADPLKCERSMERARKFVWEHWKKHKRAHLVVKVATEQHESVIHLFIEPGDDGSWRIIERTVPMPRKPEDPEHYWLGDLIDVNWKRAEAEDEKWGLKPGSKYLELRNVSGDGLNL